MSAPLAIWRILGISPTTDKRAIKRAYHKRAKALHPDRNASLDAEERFDDLQRAYEQAMTQARGEAAPAPAPAPAADNWQQQMDQAMADVVMEVEDPFTRPAPAPGAVTSFDEHLDALFDQPTAPTAPAAHVAGPARGGDVHTSISIALAEAFTGAVKPLNLTIERPCVHCAATGRVLPVCDICEGSGRLADGNACWNCRGTGRMEARMCTVCQGRAHTSETEQVHLSIPPGIRSGSLIRLPGAGHWGARERGMLIVRVQVLEGGRWRLGPDASLLMDMDVDVATAGLGGTRLVQLPDGREISIEIPPVAGDGREIVVPGRGWPATATDPAGDLRIRLRIAFPNQLTDRMREALRAFQTDS